MPFLDNFGLLDIIVAELEIGQGAASPPELRAEVMRTLGNIGAIDPYSYRGGAADLLLTPRELDKHGDSGEGVNGTVSGGGGGGSSRKNSKRRRRRSSIKRNNGNRASLSGTTRSPSKSLLPASTIKGHALEFAPYRLKCIR